MAGAVLKMATTKQFNTRLPEATVQQIEQIAQQTGMTKTQVLILAIDRMAKEQKKGKQSEGK